jgi:hypothetical protein
MPDASLTPPLWHGTERPFDIFKHRHERTRLGAFWAAPDITTAALYAGAEGALLSVAAVTGARLLDASGGVDGEPLHYMEDREAAFVRKAVSAFGWRAGEASKDPGDALTWYEDYDEGMCWEGLFQEDLPGITVNRILRDLGYDAVLCHDVTEGIENDIDDRMIAKMGKDAGLTETDNLYAYRSASIERPEYADMRLLRDAMRAVENARDTVPVVGFLHAAAVRFTGETPISGRTGLAACLDMEPMERFRTSPRF